MKIYVAPCSLDSTSAARRVILVQEWLPRFSRDGSTSAANIEDTSILAVQQGTTLAKDLLSTPPSEWDEESQDDFKAYITTALGSWSTIVIDTMEKLFDGSDEPIERLGDLMADGTFIAGSGSLGGTFISGDDSQTTEGDSETLRNSITRNFFGIAIPEIWRISGTHGFVIDTGADCDQDVSDILKEDVRVKTRVCHDGKQYFLGEPKGTHNLPDETYTFSVPPGVDALGENSRYGGITIEDIIVWSLNTFERNGGNDAPRPKELGEGDINDLAFADDLRASGLMRLPVCSPERAWRAWSNGDAGDSNIYPCNILKGPDWCSASTFANQGSDASPPVEDCLQVVKNLQGFADKDWRIEWTEGQVELASSGECAFGVEPRHAADGNIWYNVGAQDVIDITLDAVDRFGGGGRIGAKGDMDCEGNIMIEQMEWGIY